MNLPKDSQETQTQMKQRILNNTERDAFIQKVQETDVKVAYRAEFTKITRSRSLNQNAYLWLCLAIASEQTGHTKEELYDLMIEMFAPAKGIEIFGLSLMTKLTSSNFDSIQMSRFIESTRNFLAQNDIPTPDAEDKRLEDIYNDYKDRGLL